MIIDVDFCEVDEEFPLDFDGDAAELEVDFVDDDCHFDLDFEVVTIIAGSDIPVYAGPYDVIPTFDDQMLNTSGKVMTDNVEVKQIPVSVVSNVSGGTTVWIGIGV